MKKNIKKTVTKKTVTKKESEMSLEELNEVVGGAKNMDNPIVQTVIGAFNKRIKDGEAAKLEFLRNNTLGPSAPWK
jgi:hypothetical protein